VRPATERDEGGIAALATAAGGVGAWGREQRVGPEHPDRRRHVELEGDRVVGYGAIWRRKDTIFGLDALVHPDLRKRGLGRRIIDRLFEDLAELGATAVEARIDADHTAALTFMVRRGFTELNRLERVRLDVAAIADVPETVPPGIDIVPLGEARDPETEAALRAILTAAFRERPIRHLEPFTETPMERFAAELDEALPDGSFIAREAGKVIGFTGLSAGPEPGTLNAFLTATAREHRHRGIATALMNRTLAYAKQNGYRAIYSSSPNRAMQDLNEMLGFKRFAAAEIRVARRL